MYAWEMTKNQRSGLSDKAERFQKRPQDGNISWYAHFHSSRQNRWFYTKLRFNFSILFFVKEKYKAFFMISREAKKQMISAPLYWTPPGLSQNYLKEWVKNLWYFWFLIRVCSIAAYAPGPHTMLTSTKSQLTIVFKKWENYF